MSGPTVRRSPSAFEYVSPPTPYALAGGDRRRMGCYTSVVSDYEYPYPSAELAQAHPFIPLVYGRLDDVDMLARAETFRADLERRRSVRMFASDPVPPRLIELAIESAGTAPSGAHKQPWTFVAISRIRSPLR